jgi:LmbE family N-acetylglucosaminyl deacetylase
MRDPIGMSGLRHAEAVRASVELRVERFEWLGLPEGEWPAARLRDAMVPLLDELRPDLVYAPSRVDFHPEHHKVAHGLALALDAASGRPLPTVRVYQIQVPLTATLVNLVSDLETVQAPSEAALRAYESQAGTIATIYRRRRYSARRHGLGGVAEEFWQLPSDRYAELHRLPPADWRDGYRGLRHFPLTDPLAWMVGVDWRRKLLPSDRIPG